MTEKPSSLEQVRQCMRLKHYSIRTEQAYAQGIKRFILSASTQTQVLSALLFLYREVLGVALPYVEGIERARRPARVPVVLTCEGAEHILSHVGGTYRLMDSLLYGAGLRLMECVRPRVKGGDFGYRQLTVREGKGEKNRRTVLPDQDFPA